MHAFPQVSLWKQSSADFISLAGVSGDAASSSLYYERHSGPQLVFLLLVLLGPRGQHTPCLRLPEMICLGLPHSYSVPWVFWPVFTSWFHTGRGQILMLPQPQPDPPSVWEITPSLPGAGWMVTAHRHHRSRIRALSHHALALVLLLSCRNGLTHFLIRRGSTKPDTDLLHTCSYSTCCWKIPLTAVHVPAPPRDAQAFRPGTSIPNGTRCVYTKLVKRHKAAVPNTTVSSVLLVFSCIRVVSVRYSSCCMTFSVDSLLLFIS